MDCETSRECLNAWTDRQLSAAEATVVEAHLCVCAECRAAAADSRGQDALLLRAFQPGRTAARRVGQQVLSEWDRSFAAERPASTRKTSWFWLLSATAAGFLLAVLLFQPFAGDQAGAPAKAPSKLIPPTTVAELVVTTGDVEVRPPGASTWQPALETYSCPTGSSVRTGPNIRCELKTTQGGVVRLNEQTEVLLASSETLEVRAGQIWCSSPENAALKILAPQAEQQTGERATPSLVACSANASMMTAVENGGMQIITATGAVDLHAPSGHARLNQGEAASIVGGRIVRLPHPTDPLLAAQWTQALLIRKGHDDQELTRRVDQLLARVGRSKMETLYEQEIRSLGEYAVLPLLRFVQSPISQDISAQREMAMKILSDIAPSWAIGDLIKLLGDGNPQTRVHAAQALERLTGMDHGRLPTQWAEDLQICQDALLRWQRWWSAHRDRFETRPVPRPARSPAATKA